MRRSTDRILVTHVGALPAPEEIWGHAQVDEARLRDAVQDVVSLQQNAGVDFVNEGEFTRGGNWVEFVAKRLSGFEAEERGTTTADLMFASADWQDYSEFYRAAIAQGTLFEESGTAPRQGTESDVRGDWACTGPIAYVGQDLLEREIRTGSRPPEADVVQLHAVSDRWASRSLPQRSRMRLHRSQACRMHPQ